MRVFAAMVFVISIAALATAAIPPAPAYREVAATTGPWKDRVPGSFVVNRVTYRSASNDAPPPQPHFERSVLLGTDDQQQGWFNVYKSDSPNGPWTLAYGEGGGTTYFTDPEAKLDPPHTETLTVGETLLHCTVTHFELLTDSSIVTGEHWIDEATRLQLQLRICSQLRDIEPGQVARMNVTEIKTVAIEQREIQRQPCRVFVQETSETFDGKLRASGRLLISADIPGQAISSMNWSSPDRSRPADFESQLISWGIDLDMLAAERAKVEKSHEFDPERFRSGVLADAESGEPARRAKGLSTIAMNPFGEEFRSRIESDVRAALSDAKTTPEVQRAAAEAAGFQKIAGTSARIAELARLDPAGAPQYIRALGRLAEPAGLDVVLDALESNGRSNVVAPEAIANFSDDRATAAIERLLADKVATQRFAIVNALANGTNPHAADLLFSLIDDADRNVRSIALNGLVKEADTRAMQPTLKRMNDANREVRLSAIVAVCELGLSTHDLTTAREALLPLLDEKSDPAERAMAATSMARMKDDRVLPTLRAFSGRAAGEGRRECRLDRRRSGDRDPPARADENAGRQRDAA